MQFPLFDTPSAWLPPVLEDLPEWSGAKRIGLDIETCDPLLKRLGPGVRRGGYVVGISFAIEDGPAFYLPFRHQGGDNLPEESVLGYVQDQAREYKGILVGANLNYDLDFLAHLNIRFPATQWHRDIQIAEVLLDELLGSYSLDAIGKRYGFAGKDETLLRTAAHAYNVDPKGGLWRLPARYVGPYAETDARLPLQILRRQERAIEEQELWPIFNLESRVQKAILHMQRRGILIDQHALNNIVTWSEREEQDSLNQIQAITGTHLEDPWKKGPIVAILQNLGIKLTATPTGQTVVDANLLKTTDHPVAKALLRARKVNKLRTTFAESIFHHMVNGRIHCTYNQMRSTVETGEEKGARFGRVSAEHPNLQQQPSKDEFAKMWRSIYVPDDSDQLWLSADYSQQEPRMLVHYAELCQMAGLKGMSGSREAAERYRQNPATDVHQMMADLCNIPRKRAKNIFLGLCYGMGGAKLAQELELPTKWIVNQQGDRREVAGTEAQALLDKFDRNVPFVKRLAKLCEQTAQQQGYIRTILGRRCHFPKLPDGSYDWCHKALNRLIQGSSADQTKQAIVDVYEAGLPIQLQVHDELDTSINTPEEAQRIAEIMRSGVKLRVPNKVDVETGPSWGEVK